MLAIRLQRTGRKGHAQYRMIVQESRRTPTSGSVVALLGQYNPHTKVATLDTQKADFYLQHGAQPSDRVARLLKKEGVALPDWVRIVPNKTRSIRHPEKLRVNQPPEEKPAEEVPASAGEPDETAEEVPVEKTEATSETAEAVSDDKAAGTESDNEHSAAESATDGPDSPAEPEEPAK